MKHEQMKSVAHTKSKKNNNCFLQKTLYHIMQELCFRNFFSVVTKLNSNLPENRIPMILTEKESSVFPEEGSDFHKYNIIAERIIYQLSFAFFVKCYSYNRKKKIVNLKEYLKKLLGQII